MVINPGGSPHDAAGVFALLALLAEPDAAKKRLEELSAQATAAARDLQEAARLNSDATKARELAEAALADANKTSAEFRAFSATKGAELKQYEDTVSARAAQLRQDERNARQAIDEARAQLQEREGRVAQREAKIVENERAANAAREAAEKLRADLEARLSKLKELAG